MKSGASSSSSVCSSALAKASRKRRASALFLSSDDTGATSSSLMLPNPVSLSGRHHEYDATRRDQAHRLGLIHRSAWNRNSRKFAEIRLRKQLAEWGLLSPSPSFKMPSLRSGGGRLTFSPAY